MKPLAISLILLILLALIHAVRAAFPFDWVTMFPLCGGGPPSLYDVASLAVLVITVRAMRLIRQRYR